MKRILPFILTGLTCIVLHSCSVSNVSKEQRKSDIFNARETGRGIFVEYKDGKIENYESLELVTGVLKTPYLLANNNKKIFATDIRTYQTKEYYAVSQDLFEGGRRSNLAVDALPGFGIRTTRGNLNIYCKKYFNGKNSADEFFVQQGKEGKIFPYSCELVNDLLKKDPNAMHAFNDQNNETGFEQKLSIAVSIYNTREALSINN